MQDFKIGPDTTRDDIVKVFKLSDKMIDAILDGRFLAAPNTEKALESRGITGDRRAHIRAHLIGDCQVCSPVVVITPITTTTQETLSLLRAVRESDIPEDRIEAGLARLIRILDRDAKIRATRRRRVKPSKQSRRPSRQR